MELLTTSPKTTYLLEAGLEVLHVQSNEWLSEIEFWKGESTFFYQLIVSKTNRFVPLISKSSIEKIENELVKIVGGDLDDLQKEVEQHEVFLNDLLESKYLSEQSYRKRHELLTFRILGFERRFKELKNEVFKFVRQINRGE